jgi:dTDP-4-dehydrorhamnose 3,5-epimerase-like enzyme
MDRNGGDIRRCKLIQLSTVNDIRGNLTIIEASRNIPFDIKRVFYLYDVPENRPRGVHAHRSLHQLLIAANGSFDVSVSDGRHKKRYHLNRSFYGLYIPPMIWQGIYDFSSGAVCLVLASGYYDRSEYIEDFDTYRELVGAPEAGARSQECRIKVDGNGQ